MSLSPTRREALLSALFGTGYVGLRALATGLPAWAFLRPHQSLALACSGRERAQYIILSTSAAGDPMNGNVPGTYDHPDVIHPPDPAMEKTAMQLGGQTYYAARPWAMLPRWVLDRTCFFHHTTLTNSHANQAKVMKLMGAVKRQEMLVSLLARELAPCLGTVQREPVVVGAAGPGEFLTYQGRTLPSFPPTALRDVLITPAGPIAQLQALRDRDLNRLNALYKQTGNALQRRFLDRLAHSQTEVRSIEQSLLDRLASITNNGVEGQITAAVALIQMNVSPVVSIRLPFGGDNHADPDLRGETAQHLSSIAAIGTLLQRLADARLQDRVTFWAANVFGRTMHINHKGLTGRDHLAAHHCSVFIGKPFRSSVIGGIELRGRDFAATAINSRTGKSAPDGDISFNDTLGAVGKTLAAAVGVAPDVYNDQITTGKVVTAALV
ncbi:MAG: hypothetical protein RMK29_01710 [Myxococcales bacterium]|nr:DUF1501 domain-containing protein [Myxococcota bacterium]MDW8280396.1 hypothetical protein [Myxococcales bacterium]